MFSLNEFHRLNALRGREAFYPGHSMLGLVACIQEEAGEIAEAALGISGEKKRKAHLTKDDLLKEIADAMTYLSLLADNLGCSDIEGLLKEKFNIVSERSGSRYKID